MEEMGVFEAMYNCRAMRRLDTRPVPEELLLKLVDAANQAPSGRTCKMGDGSSFVTAQLKVN